MRALVLGLILAVVGVSQIAIAADSGDAIVGTWLTEDGSSKVQVADAGGTFTGQVVWLKEPNFPADDSGGMAGKPKLDRHNPDASLQGHPVMGMAVLTGLHYAGNNTWDGGTIYAPATGKSYPVKVSLAPDGTLKLTVGGGVFGRTVTWTKA